MNVLIVEDEKPAARRLQRMLSKLGVEAEAMLHSVSEGMEYLKNNRHPDLIFLDIQLGDGLSFEIFEEIEVKSAIIFTTAYDEYALKAFKLNSIDYLLKPIDEEELEAAVTKFKNIHSLKLPSFEVEKFRTALGLSPASSYKKRFVVQLGQRLKIIETDKVNCFYSENKATYIYTSSGRKYLLDTSLDALEKDLDPSIFFRISRKSIVHLESIQDIIAYTNSRLKLKLDTFDEFELIVSRERVKEFKAWIS